MLLELLFSYEIDKLFANIGRIYETIFGLISSDLSNILQYGSVRYCFVAAVAIIKTIPITATITRIGIPIIYSIMCKLFSIILAKHVFELAGGPLLTYTN